MCVFLVENWWRREVEYQLKFLAIGRLVVSGDDNERFLMAEYTMY